MRLDGVIGCVPLPLEVQRQAAVAQSGPDDLHWLRGVDQRVAAAATNLRGCGRVSIQIDQIEPSTPQFGVDEGYRLTRDDQGWHIDAATTWGGLHAITTLQQLGGADQLSVVSAVEDAPRFGWRGLLIDVARHFLSLASLRAIIDGLAYLKMNVLHLHLSDDQGFRFGSERYPRLASRQHYSKAALRELVTYAADRGVRVVPELDVPGHVTSWLVAYPEWGTQTASASRRFGVHQACLNAADEQVYTALDHLFEEVASVFDDRYIHLGGDEVHAQWWRDSGEVQAFMRAQGLDDVPALQSYFNRRVTTLIRQQGRIPIGWDEVLHPTMPDMVVQNWRGITTRDRALQRGLDCIVSSGFYLDLNYPDDMHYQFDIAAPQADLLELEDQQRSDPRLAHVAQGMAWTLQWRKDAVDQPGDGGRILGGEACLWAELVDERTWLPRLWSRLPAVAETLWRVPDDPKIFSQRAQRIAQHFEVEAYCRAQLESLGLSTQQIDLVLWLEPVKWYARLLGEEALQARLRGSEMPQARPYNADTALDRVVDFLPPQSGLLQQLQPSADLAAHFAAWQAAANLPWPDELYEAMLALADAGRIGARWLAGELDGPRVVAAWSALDHPYGEYVVAPLCALIQGVGVDDT